MDKSKLFDQKIRDAINKYEVPFDDSAWKNIEGKINIQPKAKIINWKNWVITSAAAAAIVIAYFAFNQDENKPSTHVEKSSIENIDKTINKEGLNAELPKETTSQESNESLSSDTYNKVDVGEIEKTTTALPLLEEKKIVTQDQISDSNEEEKFTENFEENNQLVNNEEEDDSGIDVLILNIHMSKEILCQNEVLSFNMSKSNVPVELSWDFGDGSFAEGPSVSHEYDEVGVYQVQLTAQSVIDEDLVSVENYSVKVNPSPIAEFEIRRNDNMAAYPEVVFKSLNDHINSLEWKINNEKILNKEIVEKVFKNKGAYSIGLIVNNQFQCSDTLYQKLVIKNDFNLLAPNAFSPNGDGINDTFMPQAFAYLNQGFILQVFETKTGQMIFESSDITNPWNGNLMNNGKKMADGAYAWSVKTEDGSVYKGTILITTH